MAEPKEIEMGESALAISLATGEDEKGNLLPQETLIDRLVIRELLDNWVLWRDAGDWERFATVWDKDGRMNATWFQAPAADFIAGCRRSFDEGMVGAHTLGGATIEVRGERAVAQTKMQIVQRALVHDVLVDVTCLGRFVDALVKRDGRWGIVLRQPVYELDRLSPLEPGIRIEFDNELLKSFPIGYRHLAYVQTQMGFDISKTLPGTRGPQIAALMSRMGRWLAGEPANCLDTIQV